MGNAIFDVSGGPITDRAFMTGWFQRRNQEVIDTLLADPEVGMSVAREYIDQLKARAFAG